MAGPRRDAIQPEFQLPTEIYIQPELLAGASQVLSRFGSRSILITTTGDFEIFSERIELFANSLKESDIGCIVYDELPASPTTEDVDLAVAFTKKTNCDLIIGFGGQESINAAKAVSLLASNFVFCNEIFSNPTLPSPPLPLVTIPAYPVFGLEIAPLFYLDEIHNLTKKVYRNLSLYPRATIIDPAISTEIDDSIAMKASVSSLAVACESIISKMNNDIANTFALKAIDIIFRNLPLAYRDPKNIVPRRYISTASVMAGIAFSTAYLSSTLAISLALAAKTDLDIHSAMSVILPHIMEFNLTSSPGKYVQMSKVMGEDVREITVIEAAIKSVEAIRKLESDLDIPQRLSNYSVSKAIYKDVAEITMGYNFVENTPRELNKSEIETILIAAY